MQPAKETALETLKKQYNEFCKFLYSDRFYGIGHINLNSISSMAKAMAPPKTEESTYLRLVSKISSLENLCLTCLDVDNATASMIETPSAHTLDEIIAQTNTLVDKQAALKKSYQEFLNYIPQESNEQVILNIYNRISPPRYTEKKIMMLRMVISEIVENNMRGNPAIGGSPVTPPDESISVTRNSPNTEERTLTTQEPPESEKKRTPKRS